jgi:hypothetical protein
MGLPSLFVWKYDDGVDKKNYVLDGHGRLQALQSLQKEGYEIPELPIATIEADSIESAKQKLLQMNSRYGKLNIAGFQVFVEDIELKLEEIDIPEICDANVPQDFFGWDESKQSKAGDTIFDCPHCKGKIKKEGSKFIGVDDALSQQIEELAKQGVDNGD